MPQMFLHGFYIVTGLYGGNGIGVPEIVKARFIQADFLYDFLIVLVNRVRFQMLSQLVCKHEAGILPAFTIL